MATVKFWLGSVGALLYDDSTDYESETGDLIEGLKQMAFAGEKALIVEMDVEDLMGPDGNRILKFIANATGVNYFTMQAGSSGSGPTLSTGGPDADEGLIVDGRVEVTRTTSGLATDEPLFRVVPVDATNAYAITAIEADLRGVDGSSNVFRGRGGEFYMLGDYGLTLYLLGYVDSTAGPKLSATKARGTEDSPTAIKSGDYIFQLIGRAQWGTVSSNRTQTARIDYVATEDQDSTHKGAKIVLNVIPTGSTTLTDILEIQGTKVLSSQDYDCASGKKYLVNGSQHRHTEDDIDLSAVTTINASTSRHGLLPQLDNNPAHFLDGQGNWSGSYVGILATKTGIDAKTVASTEIYAVPTGKSLVVTGINVRTTAFTVGSKSVQAIASFGANATTYDDLIDSETFTFTAVNKAIQTGMWTVEQPIYAAGTSFKVSIETGSDATTETWAVDLIGYLL